MRRRAQVLVALLGALLGACSDPPNTPLDATSGDTMPAHDASADAPMLLDGPLGTGPAEFSYAAVPGMVCANGTPAGIGVSAWPSDTLVLFLNGGGACWDSNTCFVLRSAAHIDTTYSANVLAADVAPLTATGLTDRAAADNPLATAAFAFVPYCTADLHAGNITRSIQYDIFGNVRPVHFRGRPNLVAAASDLAVRMPGIRQIYLMGASAGGYGAMLGLDVIEAAFPGARIDVLVDGSPTIQPFNLWGTWRTTWNMTIADCTTCDQQFPALPLHLTATRPDRRLALITTTNDEVIRPFFGYGLGDITPQVTSLVNASYRQDPAHAFVVPGVRHVLLGGYRTLLGPGGASLKAWFDAWASGDASWTTVGP